MLIKSESSETLLLKSYDKMNLSFPTYFFAAMVLSSSPVLSQLKGGSNGHNRGHSVDEVEAMNHRNLKKNQDAKKGRNKKQDDVNAFQVISAEGDLVEEEVCEPVKDLGCDVDSDPITVPEGPNLNARTLIEPFECIRFNKEGDTEGFDKCPGWYDNIFVRHSTDSAITTLDEDNHVPDPNDFFLHVQDRSHASLACGTGSSYTGNWMNIVNQRCYEFCWDVKIFHDGCFQNLAGCEPNGSGGWFKPIKPAIVLQGGAPNYYRASFNANFYITSDAGDNSGWHRICAPLAPLDSAGNLPSNAIGSWNMGGFPCNILSGVQCTPTSTAPNSAWSTLLSDITAIELPVDYTSNPAERVGYDNICMEERDCTDYCDPEPLCYWQHEWNCENLKRHRWYSKPNYISDTISPIEAISIKDKNDVDILSDIRPVSKEMYFVDLMDDLTPSVFSSTETCICKVLNDCCPDRCAMAEQELLAMLLNVASGKLKLECCVDDCYAADGADTTNVKDVIHIINDLLGETPRSQYNCAKALDLATGVNADKILCDSK